MNIWHNISPKRISKDSFMAVIEIPQGSKVKYELDKETGVLMMDRILPKTTALSQEHMPRTEILLMFLFFVRRYCFLCR